MIVGGGAAGCVLAARLSEDPSSSVLLLEAGPGELRALTAAPLPSLRLIPWLSWGDATEPQAGLDGRRVAWPTGRLLGGGTAINAMMHVRGQPEDFDGWERLGATGWNHSALLPWFVRSETWTGPAHPGRGTSGPFAVSPPRHLAPLSHAFLAACDERGLPRLADYNAMPGEGAAIYQVAQREGRRESAASAWLRPARPRPNLQVRTRARVTRLQIEGGRAIGVEYVVGRRRHSARAQREVVLTAGALRSPQLLMLSGIGPAEELRRVGFEVRVERPGVGVGLQDHLRVPLLFPSRALPPGAPRNWLPGALRYLFRRRGVFVSNCCEVGAFLCSGTGGAAPDVQLVTHFQSEHGRHLVDLEVCQLAVASRGRLTLRSADPLAPPRADPRYLAEPADLAPLLAGLRVARELAASRALREFGLGEEALPGPAVQSDGALAAHVRAHAQTGFHPVGTCRMGTDADAVVDPELRVHGVAGLRVADASVMPRIPRANTAAAVLAIAERAATLIRDP